MLGIIGGSGFYAIDGLEIIEQRQVETPYGAPSAPLVIARHQSEKQSEIAFLPRHGGSHTLLPSEINYRANIWALKSCGVRQLVAVSAVGSLRHDLAPGDFVVPTQYIDHTKGIRERTFFGNGLVAHVSTATPVCPTLSTALADAAAAHHTVHRDKTYVCVEGPRLGSRAESFFLRDAMNADIVGMTNVPEVFLAREAQISYATLAVVTDFDCWLDDPAQHVTVEEVIRRFGDSITRAKQVIATIAAAPPPVDDAHRCVLHASVLTPPPARTDAHRALLDILEQ
ncbi:MAG: S-methyl-5'-thioadenosine phosphorylase [Proteobacteria bacterium]|nr:S-methyl-5'-thioadenosine phosphorylase [Pseudomonadota bacterium]